MKALAISIQNFEDITKQEISENNGKIIKSDPGVVIYESSKEKIIENAYKFQSVSNLLFLLYELQGDTVDDLAKSLQKNVSMDIIKDFNFETFCLRCHRHGEHDFSSKEIEEELGGIFYTFFKQNNISAEVNLTQPNLLISAYLFDDRMYVGISIANFELSKRDYKVYNCPFSIKGNLAYCLVRYSGFHPGELLLDPFMGAGEIPIEATHFELNKSVHFHLKDKFLYSVEGLDNIKQDKTNINGYDKSWPHLNYAKKNSKIAGINKYLNLSKVEVEWLDTKFKQGEVNRIVTFAPSESKSMSKKDAEKGFTDLFYTSEQILDKKGRIVILVRDDLIVKDSIQKYKFTIEEQRSLIIGDKVYYVIKIKKK